MLSGITIGLVVVLLLILAAEFVNGATDAPNAIATVVSTRVLSPRAAVALASILNGVGAFTGTAVAATVGKGFVQTDSINLTTIGAAMIAIVFWSSLAWRYGIPTSESHALVASLTGAAFATGGIQALLWVGWQKILIGLVFSTFIGFGAGLIIMVGIYWLCRRWTPRKVDKTFGRLQILSAGTMALSHGSNDGQKFMGVFVLALMVGGVFPATDKFSVPWWVILCCAGIMTLGTAMGGWRIVRNMGMRMVHLQPPQGFAAETGATAAILAASYWGIPLSTTHTISTSIMGVGACRRLSAVRWGIVQEFVLAWILTFPVCAAIGWGTVMVVKVVTSWVG